jgi:hypothetical protein
VGFFPAFFPPERGLGHTPVHRQPGPVDAAQAVVVKQPELPELKEDAGLDPFLEAVVGGRPGAEPGGVQGLPLAAGAQDVEDGVGTDALRGPRPAATEAVGVDMLGEADLQELPEFVGDAPGVGNVHRVHDDSSCGMLKHLQEL